VIISVLWAPSILWRVSTNASMSQRIYLLSQFHLSHLMTSGQKAGSPADRRTWTVQTYSPDGANVHLHLIHASLSPHESASQTVSRSVQPFLHSSLQTIPILHNALSPFTRGIWTPILYMVSLAPWRPYPKICRTHNCDRQGHWLTDRPHYSVCNT